MVCIVIRFFCHCSTIKLHHVGLTGALVQEGYGRDSLEAKKLLLSLVYGKLACWFELTFSYAYSTYIQNVTSQVMDGENTQY